MAPAVSCFRPFPVDGPLASKSIRRVLGASLLGVCALARAAEAPARFDVWEYRVNGNSLLPQTTIEKVVYPFLGPDRSFEDVDAVRGALEQAYAEAGYRTVAVNLPQQEVRGGVVQIEVVERPVGRLRVSGARYFSPERMKAAVPALAEGTVPHFPTVQQQLDRLRGNPDREFFQVLREGRREDEVEVELKVKDQSPLHGTLSLNDRYSANTERLRSTVSLRYDNLWQREHGVGLTWITAPQNPKDATVFAATYRLPFGGDRRVLALYGVHSESDVAALGGVGVIGNGDIFGARWVLPLGGDASFWHTLTLGVDYKKFDETLNLLGADALKTPISYTPLSAEYSATRRDEPGFWQGNLGLHFAPRGLLGNDEAEFAEKRYNAKPNFVYLNAGIERQRRLPGGFGLNLSVDGQLVDAPLISNEQYAAGGADTVRGYVEAEELGDRGVRGGIVLSRPVGGVPGVDELIALSFVEGARLWLVDALPGQDARLQLASVGAGLRLTVRKQLSTAVDFALPLTDASTTQAGDWRWLFAVDYAF